MSKREHQHGVARLFIAVKRKIARPPARDDQLSHALLGRAANERMVFENLYRFRDQGDRFQRHGRFGFEQEICQPLKVGKRPPGIDQSCQDLASGLETLTPVARARM